jgi:hypothetical protein
VTGEELYTRFEFREVFERRARRHHQPPPHDFYDLALPFEIRANYERNAGGLNEQAEATWEREALDMFDASYPARAL